MDFLSSVCCQRLLAKARRQDYICSSVGGLAVFPFFWIKLETATLRVTDLSSLSHTGRAKDRQRFHNDETKRKMVFVSAVEFRGDLCPVSANRRSLGASFTHSISQECKRQFRLHRFLRRLDGVHICRLYVRQFEAQWKKPACRLPLQLWGHRAFLLAGGPVHGDRIHQSVSQGTCRSRKPLHHAGQPNSCL